MSPPTSITTIASVAGLIAAALRSSGRDASALLRDCGIDVSVLDDPGARVRVDKLQKLWWRAANATSNEAFGLAVAMEFQPAALHGLGFAWLASDTLRDAFERLRRYSCFINPGFQVDIVDEAERTSLLLKVGDRIPNIAPPSMDFALAILLRMCRLTAARDLAPMEVTMDRSAPANTKPYTEFFGPRVTFGAQSNTLVFDRALVERPLTTRNPELARINDQTVLDYLARVDEPDVSKQVRSAIIERLPGGSPGQQAIASAMHMSSRSLQRRLRGENTTFMELLDETRRELAIRYLEEQRRPVSEVTYLLGFSEPANFTRAFRRWTGVSPREYRRRSASGQA